MLDSGVTSEEMAFRVLEGLEPQLLDSFTAEYRCDCSRERVETALISLGRKELEDMAAEEEKSEVCCHFCNKKYIFTRHEILGLVSKL